MFFLLTDLDSGIMESPRTPRTPSGDGPSLRKVLDQRRQLVMQLFEEEKTFFPSSILFWILVHYDGKSSNCNHSVFDVDSSKDDSVSANTRRRLSFQVSSSVEDSRSTAKVDGVKPANVQRDVKRCHGGIQLTHCLKLVFFGYFSLV